MNSGQSCRRNSVRARVRLYLASSNPGKLAEYQALAAGGGAAEIDLALVPSFAELPEFEENAPTFGENALGKALHYSRFCGGLLLADDSGLVVPALGGAPGVHSARYAGPGASSEQKIAKLLVEMRDLRGGERAAYFVCVIAAVREGRGVAVVSERVDGEILEAPRGRGGFGYDPVFYVAELKKTLAETSEAEKNRVSHRGKAFRSLLATLR
jgi:XTP/dITP diphosphohydrolase